MGRRRRSFHLQLGRSETEINGYSTPQSRYGRVLQAGGLDLDKFGPSLDYCILATWLAVRICFGTG